MAIDDWDGRDDWSRHENRLWANMAEDNFADDRMAQTLYHAAFFEFGESPDQTNAIRDAFRGYMAEYYDVDVNEAFDYNAWRELYASGAV